MLLVEDEDSVREFTALVLGQAGHSVLTAAGGDEAVALSDTHPATSISC